MSLLKATGLDLNMRVCNTNMYSNAVQGLGKIIKS